VTPVLYLVLALRCAGLQFITSFLHFGAGFWVKMLKIRLFCVVFVPVASFLGNFASYL